MNEGTTIITSVVAHIDHGKTTLIDSLVAIQGKISKTVAGDIRYMDTREDEQDRGITLKLSALTIEYEDISHIIIDTPGHVDFEFLIESSSVLSDCFLIVIDIMEGITPRIYSLVNYIRKECAVLVINKIDKVESEEESIEKINSIISSINGMLEDDVFEWSKNNVVICCGTLCYGINHNLATQIFNRNDLKVENALKFIFYLERMIQIRKIDKICEKYGIKAKIRKNIMSTVLPLGRTIFNSIISVFKHDSWRIRLRHKSLPLKIDYDLEDHNETMLFCSLGILRMNKIYEKENLVFITRLFNGILRKGDFLYHKSEIVQIRRIFLFSINE